MKTKRIIQWTVGGLIAAILVAGTAQIISDLKARAALRQQVEEATALFKPESTSFWNHYMGI